jgi:hypothetical protein
VVLTCLASHPIANRYNYKCQAPGRHRRQPSTAKYAFNNKLQGFPYVALRLSAAAESFSVAKEGFSFAKEGFSLAE